MIREMWNYFDLKSRDGENGTVYYNLIAKLQLLPGTDLFRPSAYDPALKEPKEGALEVYFYDEAHTRTVKRPGRYIDESWWAANGPPSIPWQDFAASSRIFSTTAGMCMGLLPHPGPGSEYLILKDTT